MQGAATTYRRPPEGFFGRIAYFPPIRLVLFAAGIAGTLWLLRQLTGSIANTLGTGWPSQVAHVVLPILAIHFAYCGITRLLERRSADELGPRGAVREASAGAMTGAACLTLTVALVFALGYYRVEGVGAWTALLTAFGIAATSSYIEEVIFRGVLFRIVEEGLGTWLALGITVAVFGLAHLGNPNATLYGAVVIGVEAGVLLGAAYVVTRRLWLAIGVHFGWNFMQAGVFGPNLSGHEVGSLLQSRLSGPDFLSGGELGVEGSLFAVLVCGAVSFLLLTQARRRGLLIRPFWRRNAPS